MLRPLLLCSGLLVFSLGVPGPASPRTSARVRPSVIVRAKDGSVDIRCSHLRVKSWRGAELHPGDTVRVGPGGWASVSVEATGARFLLKAGSDIRIESSGIRRVSGPMPDRSFEIPRRDPTKPTPGEDENPTSKKPAPSTFP